MSLPLRTEFWIEILSPLLNSSFFIVKDEIPAKSGDLLRLGRWLNVCSKPIDMSSGLLGFAG